MTLEPLSLPMTFEVPIPCPPHDPRDRELLLRTGDWEVRSFHARWFQFFAPRGMWHVQLWRPGKNVSILTPSTFTRGAYELNPSAERAGASPIRSMTYGTLARAVFDAHGTIAPSAEQMAWIESVFVRRIADVGDPLH